MSKFEHSHDMFLLGVVLMMFTNQIFESRSWSCHVKSGWSPKVENQQDNQTRTDIWVYSIRCAMTAFASNQEANHDLTLAGPSSSLKLDWGDII